MIEQPFKHRKHLLVAFKEVFNTENGKKVLQTIAEMCGNSQSTFDNDPIVMAYRASRRDVYLEIQRLVDTEIKTNLKDQAEESDQAQSVVDGEEDPLS